MRNKQKRFFNEYVEFVHRFIKPPFVIYSLRCYSPELGWCVVAEAKSYSYRLAKKKAIKHFLGGCYKNDPANLIK